MIGNVMRLVGNAAQLCSAVRSQVTEGRAAGTRLVHVANGCLNLVLDESHALDVVQLWHEGVNVSFVSRNGLYPGAGDFVQRFPGGMLYTCGLDATGVVEGHPVHGRIHSIPAEIRELKADADGVRIVAEIRDTALFGSDLAVTRTIETAAGSGELTVTDELVNRAFTPAEYAMLYHVNVGYPLADAGARIEADIAETVPRTPWSREHAATMLEVEPPADGMDEFCYFHTLRRPEVSLVNPRLGRRLTLGWSGETLPKFIEWKSRASGDFAIGLEPATCWLDGHFARRPLAPGARVVNRLTLALGKVELAK